MLSKRSCAIYACHVVCWTIYSWPCGCSLAPSTGEAAFLSQRDERSLASVTPEATESGDADRSSDSQCLAPAGAGIDWYSHRAPLFPFLAGFACLLLGYAIYGHIAEKIISPDDKRETPAFSMKDDIDFLPLPDAKVFLIQLLNIAGLGPIFGPVLGAVYGYAAFFWIVFGCIFCGSIMDYLCGMMSISAKGASVPTIIGQQLGRPVQQFTNLLSVVLLILVGVVFVKGPAALLAEITFGNSSKSAWTAAIFCYYIIATLLPVDKVIGRIYPLFGVALLFMTVGLLAATLFSGREFPSLESQNSSIASPYPAVCVVISCSALSGFHSTQTPMMARCLKKETSGRRIFFGAMITEGVIGLIWAMASLVFFGGRDNLAAALSCKKGNPSPIVEFILVSLLGRAGGAVAIIGIIVLPITSGDTAFRSARLILAEWLGWTENQKLVSRRLMLALPLFGVASLISFVNFKMLWLYFNFTNQFVSTLVLWAGASYLFQRGKFHWIASVPACWMTVILATYVAQSDEFGTSQIPLRIAAPIGAGVGLALTAACISGICCRSKAVEAPDNPSDDSSHDTSSTESSD